MKKFAILLSVAALAFGTISCKKPVDPVTPDDPVTPVKKIAQLDYVGHDSLGVEALTTMEIWNWEGDVLKSIEIPHANTTEEFTYENGRIVSSTFRNYTTYYTYNGDKLVKTETVLKENETIGKNFVTFEFEYQGDKISKIINTHQFSGAKDLPVNPLRLLLPIGVSNDIMANEAKSVAKASRDGEIPYRASTFEYTLTWNGDNVTRMNFVYSYTNGDETEVEEGLITYTYDDKHNPMQGFIYYEKLYWEYWNTWNNIMFSANNVLTSTELWLVSGDYDNRIYQYTYDGDGYPTDYSYQRDTNDDHDVEAFRITYVK